jgi:hypothetical protein
MIFFLVSVFREPSSKIEQLLTIPGSLKPGHGNLKPRRRRCYKLSMLSWPVMIWSRRWWAWGIRTVKIARQLRCAAA